MATKVSKPKKPEHKQTEETPRAPQIHLVRGMRDILPSEQLFWEHLRAQFLGFVQSYGYTRIDTPILEDRALFERTAGATSTIVEQELFSFTDAGGDRVCLRPEGTAGVVRAYIEHGMINQPQPVKLWYAGPMFRYERPQAGRYRQFHQFGMEILGEAHPATDAELMNVGTNFLRSLGIPVTIQVNSIGCPTCRPSYEEELQTYCKTHRTELCEECRQRTQRGAFLRCFDCTETSCRQLHEGAPQIVDWLCEECKKHFIRVLEYLDELEVPYALSPFLVRGLDYYTKTVFEFWPTSVFDGEGPPPAQVALAAGGRYDGLVEALGGRPTPATGLAFGVERIIAKLKDAIAAGEVPAPAASTPAVYLAQLGDQAKRKAMRLFEELRRDGLQVAANFSKDALKAQLEHANRSGARLTLILGQKEVIDGTLIVREMSSGIQEIVAYDRVLPEVRKRLEQEAVKERVEESLKVVESSEEAPTSREGRTAPIAASNEEGGEEGMETIEES